MRLYYELAFGANDVPTILATICSQGEFAIA